MRVFLVLVSVALAMFLVTACDSSAGGPGAGDAPRCAVVSSYSCINDVAHLCRSNNGDPIWAAYEDCAQSATNGCHCTMPAGGGFAYCSTNGETSGACQGQKFNLSN